MAKADMFLRLEGQKTGIVKGESNAPNHLEEIEILGFDWGMSSTGAFSGRGAATKAALNELRLTKNTDAASTQLMSVMRNNELIKTAVLSVRKAGVSPPFDYLKITIQRGRISSLTIANDSPGLPELFERLSIAFEEIEVEYAAQDPGGGKKASSLFNASVSP